MFLGQTPVLGQSGINLTRSKTYPAFFLLVSYESVLVFVGQTLVQASFAQ